METREPSSPLRGIFLARHRTYAEFGRDAGFHGNTVGAIAAGTYRWPPSWRTWCRLAKAAGRTPHELSRLYRPKRGRAPRKAENRSVLSEN